MKALTLRMYAKFLFHGLTSYNLICQISLLSVVYLQSFILLAKTRSRDRANSGFGAKKRNRIRENNEWLENEENLI